MNENPMMKPLDGEQLIRWKKKRFVTLIMYCIQYFVNGILAHMILSSSWIYVTSQLKPEKPNLIYSLIIYLIFLPAAMFILIVSRLIDKYRRAKLFLVILNSICLIGHLLYVMDISVYFPMIGSYLIGFRTLMEPVMIGELVRSYPPEKLTYILPFTTFMLYSSILPAALVLYVTSKTEFLIGPFYVTFGNFEGVLMVSLYTVMLLLTILFVHDLSREYDLKEHVLNINNKLDNKIQSQDECTEYLKKVHTSRETQPLLEKQAIQNNKYQTFVQNLKRVFTNFDVLVVYFLLFLFSYISYLSFAALPIVITSELTCSIQYYNVFCIGFAVMFSILMPTIILVKIQSKIAYYIGLVCYILIFAVGICLKFINPEKSKFYNISFLSVIAVLLALIHSGEDVFLTCTVAKLVKPDIQSFSDGIRVICRVFGAGLGCFSAGFYMRYKDELLLGLMILLLFAMLMMIKRKETLTNPKAVV